VSTSINETQEIQQRAGQSALTAVTKEMEQPRFAESARREEEAAGHHATNAKRKLG